MEHRLLVLGLLLSGRMHGYRLNELLEHSMGFYADLKKPTAYYTLKKLEEEGCVRYEVEREGNRPERRVYEITERGRELFFELLRENLRKFSQPYYADEVGLALMNHLPTAEVRELLLEKRAKAEALLESIRGHPAHGTTWHHVLSHATTHLEAEIEWLDGVIDELESKESWEAEAEVLERHAGGELR